MHTPVRILFVVNPIAGGKGSRDWEGEIRKAVNGHPATLDFFMQTGANDRPALLQRIADFSPQKVVAVGGDGTVKMVAEAVKESTMILGIVPAGSANGLAKELGIPVNVQAAVDIILEGTERGMDAVRINEEHLSFHLSDAGLNALLVKYFEDGKVRGMWGYARSLLKMLWNKRRMRVAIELDGETVKRKAYMVALANAERYGTGAVINPDGSVGDGAFEIVVVRKINVWHIIKSLLRHKTFDPKKIEVLRTKSVELRFQQAAHFQIDGEYMGKWGTVKARIQPGIVRVMVPKKG